MARRKNENIRKLQNPTGRSYTVSVPIGFVRFFRWKEHQKVVFELDKKRKRIVINGTEFDGYFKQARQKRGIEQYYSRVRTP